jgi:hypothetical protein
MPTPRETFLAARHTVFQALPAAALRGDVLPERVPTDGLLILRDGEPGSLRSHSHPCAITTSTASRSRQWCRALIVMTRSTP